MEELRYLAVHEEDQYTDAHASSYEHCAAARVEVGDAVKVENLDEAIVSETHQTEGYHTHLRPKTALLAPPSHPSSPESDDLVTPKDEPVDPELAFAHELAAVVQEAMATNGDVQDVLNRAGPFVKVEGKWRNIALIDAAPQEHGADDDDRLWSPSAYVVYDPRFPGTPASDSSDDTFDISSSGPELAPIEEDEEDEDSEPSVASGDEDTDMESGDDDDEDDDEGGMGGVLSLGQNSDAENKEEDVAGYEGGDEDDQGSVFTVSTATRKLAEPAFGDSRETVMSDWCVPKPPREQLTLMRSGPGRPDLTSCDSTTSTSAPVAEVRWDNLHLLADVSCAASPATTPPTSPPGAEDSLLETEVESEGGSGKSSDSSSSRFFSPLLLPARPSSCPLVLDWDAHRPCVSLEQWLFDNASDSSRPSSADPCPSAHTTDSYESIEPYDSTLTAEEAASILQCSAGVPEDVRLSDFGLSPSSGGQPRPSTSTQPAAHFDEPVDLHADLQAILTSQLRRAYRRSYDVQEDMPPPARVYNADHSFTLRNPFTDRFQVERGAPRYPQELYGPASDIFFNDPRAPHRLPFPESHQLVMPTAERAAQLLVQYGEMYNVTPTAAHEIREHFVQRLTEILRRANECGRLQFLDRERLRVPGPGDWYAAHAYFRLFLPCRVGNPYLHPWERVKLEQCVCLFRRLIQNDDAELRHLVDECQYILDFRPVDGNCAVIDGLRLCGLLGYVGETTTRVAHMGESF